MRTPEKDRSFTVGILTFWASLAIGVLLLLRFDRLVALPFGLLWIAGFIAWTAWKHPEQFH